MINENADLITGYGFRFGGGHLSCRSSDSRLDIGYQRERREQQHQHHGQHQPHQETTTASRSPHRPHRLISVQLLIFKKIVKIVKSENIFDLGRKYLP